MNTIYLKSVLMFVLGSAITSEAYLSRDTTDSLVNEHQSEKRTLPMAEDMKQAPFATASTKRASNHLDIPKADSMILQLQLWQRMAPRFITLKGDSIHYAPTVICSADLETVRNYVAVYNNINKNSPIVNYTNIPYSTPNSMARSYYISPRDIHEIQRSYGDTAGIRIYMGLTGINYVHPDSVSTHAILVPAIDSLNDVPIKSVHYVYDLTMPCPSTCPNNEAALFKYKNPCDK